MEHHIEQGGRGLIMSDDEEVTGIINLQGDKAKKHKKEKKDRQTSFRCSIVIYVHI
jgi:hypothetical protein